MMRPGVLVFAGSDPSAGAGLQADVLATAANGAHPLTVVTAVTVQDNDRVFSVNPVDPELVSAQALALIAKVAIAAVKIGIPGSLANARVIADVLAQLKQRQPALPVVLDTVLASGHGHALSADDALLALRSLLPHATIATPNLPEATALCMGEQRIDVQAEMLLRSCPHLLIKGGHGSGDTVVDTWFAREDQCGDRHPKRRSWRRQRVPGEFHGTGCTLASALAARLAHGDAMADALERTQDYVDRALRCAYPIAAGQRIPQRLAQ